MSKESLLNKLKQEVRGLLVSSPRGLTLHQFLKDYKESIGKTFPFEQLGYKTINELFKDISDVVRLEPVSSGYSILIPVTNDKVNHINSMVSRQKIAPNKFAYRTLPRKSIQEDYGSLRKPVQLPLENKKNSSRTDDHTEKEIHRKSPDSVSYNDKNGKILNSSEDVSDVRSYKNQSSYDESTSYKYSSGDSQSDNYSDHYLQSNMEDYTCNNFDDHNNYEYGAQLSENVKQFFNGFGNYGVSGHDYVDNGDEYVGSPDEDELERPPTPGEIIISKQMATNFKQLLANHPEGLPSSKFCKLYKENFGANLLPLNYGFQSFKEMVAGLPDVFSYRKQPQSHQDWILFDANATIPSLEEGRWIPCDILENILTLVQLSPNGVRTRDLLILYRERFKVELNVEKLGFNSVESFLKKCSSVNYVNVDGEDKVIAKRSHKPPDLNNEQSSNHRAVPPVAEMPFLWGQHFSGDECDPSMGFPPFKLIKGNELYCAKVYVCDAISPSKLWLQMDEQREELDKLMFNLNEYYNQYENDHILSDNSFIIKDLICTVRFVMDNRWHRAKVLSFNHSTNQVMVLYVDYGTENEVKADSIRKLRKHFADLPVQAIQASLYGIMPNPKLGSNWTKECVEFIYELTIENRFNIDVREIDEFIPKLEIILHNENNALTVNDQVLAENHAISVVSHSSDNDDRKVRTPPGYSSKTNSAYSTLSSPKKNMTSSSTCERIRDLQVDAVWLLSEARRIADMSKQKFLEAKLLEQVICQHSHPEPEGLEMVSKYVEDSDNVTSALNKLRDSSSNFSEDSTSEFNSVNRGDSNFTFSKDPLNYQGEHVHMYNQSQNRKQQMFGQSPMMEINQKGSELGYNQMVDHPSYHHQIQQVPPRAPHMNSLPTNMNHHNPSYQPFHRPMTSNMIPPRMVNPPFVMRQPLYNMPGRPSFTPAGTEIFYPRPSMGQWVNPMTMHPPGMYPPVRQDMYPQRHPGASGFKSSTESLKNLSRKVSTLKNDLKTNCDVLSKPFSQPPVNKDITPTVNYAPATQINKEVDVSSSVFQPETEVEPQDQPLPLTPPTNDIASEFILKPTTNNWSDLLPSPLTSSGPAKHSSDESSSTDFSNQTLVDIIMRDRPQSEEEDGDIDDEYKKLEDAIMETMGQNTRTAVNFVFKICVENIHGASTHIVLLLVNDSVAVQLRQLFTCCWWGEPGDEEEYYQNFLENFKKNPLFDACHSIFYSDHISLFSKLREENLIDNDDLYIPVINLCDDVAIVLDYITDISPIEDYDLSGVKDMFEKLSRVVLPEDTFWFSDKRHPGSEE